MLTMPILYFGALAICGCLICLQDFRIINMSVSPAKVRDTAELFYMQNQRKISLRYLAWYFLNMDVQVRFPKLGLSQTPCIKRRRRQSGCDFRDVV